MIQHTKDKTKNKTSKQANKTPSLLHLSCLSIDSAFVLVALGAAVYHAVHSLAQTTSHAIVHCVVYIIIVRPSLNLLSDILLVS